MQRHDEDQPGPMGQTSSGGNPILGLMIGLLFSGFVALLAALAWVVRGLDWHAWLGMGLL